MRLFLGFLLVVHTASFALDSWHFTVNQTAVVCEGFTEGRFWRCTGDAYFGMIDRTPATEDLPFLPLFFDEKSALALELEITEWKDFQDKDLLRETLYFSERNYYEFDDEYFKEELKNIEDTISGGSVIPKHRKTLIKLGYLFLEKLNEYLTSLKSLPYIQIIYQNKGVICSQLQFIKSNFKKEDFNTIKCLGRNQLSLDNRFNLTAITDGAGREPSFSEGLQLLKEIIEYTDIPFSYTKDGCYARSHIIAYRLHKLGIHTGKIWVSGDLINPLAPDQFWNFHVAPLIYITGDEGERVPFVIDPMINDKTLLTVDEWLSGNNFTYPKLMTFPLPEYHHFFTETVMAFSSYLPLSPYKYDDKKTLKDTLREAEEINQKHLKKLGAAGITTKNVCGMND